MYELCISNNIILNEQAFRILWVVKCEEGVPVSRDLYEAESRGVTGGSMIRKRVTISNGRRDVTPKRYRYVTRATTTTKYRVGQECSSTQRALSTMQAPPSHPP